MEQMKENKIKAIGLSLLVAIIGAVVWGVVYSYGWLVSLVAYVSAFFMLQVYNKYCKSNGKGKYFYVFITILVLNIIASFLALVVYCANYYGLEFKETFDILVEKFSLYPEEFSSFLEKFISDMFWDCVFAGLGIFSAVSYEKKKLKQEDFEAELKASVQEEKTDEDTMELQPEVADLKEEDNTAQEIKVEVNENSAEDVIKILNENTIEPAQQKLTNTEKVEDVVEEKPVKKVAVKKSATSEKTTAKKATTKPVASEKTTAKKTTTKKTSK